MTSERKLANRARKMPNEVKETIVKTYVLSLYMYQVFDGEDGQTYTVSPDGVKMAKHLLKDDKWIEYREGVERDLAEYEAKTSEKRH